MKQWALALALFSTTPAARFDRIVEAEDFAVVRAAVELDLAEQAIRVAQSRSHYMGEVTPFVAAWLGEGKWDHVATVERPDRRLNRPDLCGETRLLFRLRHKDVALPAVVNVVYEWRTAETCAEFWKHRPALGKDWARLELNLQSARWADGGKGRFVDQVRYLLRVFRKVGGSLEVAPLENTPDVDRIAKDPVLKAELLDWLKSPETEAAARRGFPALPEKFAATVSESVTPFGLDRLANRPFKALFETEDIDHDYLRRLDSLTCVGCHQNGAVAGFHVLGKTRAVDGPSLLAPFSPYFAAVQPWRERSLEEAASPLPDPAFPQEESLPERDGDDCESMALLTKWHAEDDTQMDVRLELCPRGGVCASTTNGFPGGMCSAPCRKDLPGTSCERVPTLGPFSICRRQGESFASCLGKHHQVTALRACAAPADCRPDYACIRNDRGTGYCAPAYVLPHLNIEHH